MVKDLLTDIRALERKVGHLPGYVEKGMGTNLTFMKDDMDMGPLGPDLTSSACAGDAVPLDQAAHLARVVTVLVSLDEEM